MKIKEPGQGDVKKIEFDVEARKRFVWTNDSDNAIERKTENLTGLRKMMEVPMCSDDKFIYILVEYYAIDKGAPFDDAKRTALVLE